MKKYIILFLCSFCFHDLRSEILTETQMDTIIPGRENLPPAPEAPAPNYEAPQPPPNYEAPQPPPNYQAPQPPAPTANNVGRPESAAIGTEELDLLLNDLKKVPIQEVWRKSNGDYSVSFRRLILNNYVSPQAGISNWFAACATLAGTFDQVSIKQNEVMQKAGYWDQFVNSYNLIDPTIFDNMGLRKIQMRLDPNCGENLLHLLNSFGPIVIAAEGADKAVVITEVACNSNNQCFVHVLDFAPWAVSPTNAATTENNQRTTLVPEGTKIGLLDKLKRRNYNSIGNIGLGIEMKMSILELISKFSTRSTSFLVWLGADEMMVARAEALKSQK